MLLTSYLKKTLDLQKSCKDRTKTFLVSLVDQSVKKLPAMQESQVQSLGQRNPLKKEMTTHSSLLAWRTPQTEETGRLQSMGLQRVRHDLATEQQQMRLGVTI